MDLLKGFVLCCLFLKVSGLDPITLAALAGGAFAVYKYFSNDDHESCNERWIKLDKEGNNYVYLIVSKNGKRQLSCKNERNLSSSKYGILSKFIFS